MKVLLKNNKGGLTSYDVIPCENGDTIEIRHFYGNGLSRFVSGRGENWWRLDGQVNNQPHNFQFPGEDNNGPNN